MKKNRLFMLDSEQPYSSLWEATAMNEIVISNNNGELTVSRIQVAEDFDKDHRHVTEKIRNLIAENSAVKNFFTETTYISERGRAYKSYDMTRDGFSLLVMGFTGSKALEWKLKYIEAFNLMEKQLQQTVTAKEQAQLITQDKIKIAELLLATAQLDGVSEPTRNRIANEITEMLTEKKIQKTEKHYSATEIGEMFGLSAQKIGKISNEHNLKTEEYGEWYKDITANGKEIDTFRYNQKAIEKFSEIIE